LYFFLCLGCLFPVVTVLSVDHPCCTQEVDCYLI
jgi:hypothetical protein